MIEVPTRRAQEATRQAPPEGERCDGDGLPMGTVVDRYVVLGRLGAGGMGIVYRAYDPDLDRSIALKVLRTRAGADETGGRLLREAQAMARLSHPNVVAVHDVGRFGVRVFIAMELVDGTSLRRWLSASRAWQEIVATFVAAGRGLFAAHRVGLVHCDFKPENVLVASDGRVLVTDFGVALQQTSNDASDHRGDEPHRTSRFGGTPAYMAPEQRQRIEATPRSDQYSFCVSLWEALYGHRPAAVSSTRSSIGSHDDKTVLRRAEVPLGTSVATRVHDALLRGLSVDPERRFPSLGELLGELEQAMAPRRRRKLPVVFGLGLGLSALGLTWTASGDDVPCLDADQRIEAVDDLQAQLEPRWREVGPFALGSLDHVTDRLSSYRTAWVAAYRTSCEATLVHGERSAQAFDVAMACLDRRRAAFSTALALLRDPDRQVLLDAAHLTEGLDPIEPCTNVEALSKSEPLPADPSSREQTARIQMLLGQADALADVGRYGPSLEAATQAWNEAQRLGHRPTLADAAHRRASGLWLVEEIDPAIEALRESYFLASSAGHDVRAAYIAAGLTLALTLAKADYAQAETWYRHAAADLERIGRSIDDEPDMLRVLGALRGQRGEYVAAIEVLERALRILREAGDGETVLAATVMNDMANLCDHRGDYEQAKALHERALALRTRLAGSVSPEVGDSHAGLADALHGLDRPDEALTHYERAYEISLAVDGADSLGLAHDAFSLGRALLRVGRHEEAHVYLERALELRKRHLPPDHPDVARTYGALGLNSESLERFDEAETYLRLSVTTLERKLGDEHPFVGEALVNLGEFEVGRARFEAARPTFERALRLFEAAFPDGHLFVGVVQRNLAIIATAQGRFADANRLYEAALALQAKLVEPGHAEATTTSSSYADALERQGRFVEARARLKALVELQAGAIAPDPETFSQQWTKLAIVDVKLGRYDDAREDLQRAQAFADASKSELVRAYLEFARHDLEAATGNRRNARRQAVELLSRLRAEDISVAQLQPRIERWLEGAP